MPRHHKSALEVDDSSCRTDFRLDFGSRAHRDEKLPLDRYRLCPLLNPAARDLLDQVTFQKPESEWFP